MNGLKLQGWTPNKMPPEERRNYIRNLCIRIVYANHNRDGSPTTLSEIARKVQEHVNKRIQDHTWPANWGWVSKRSSDRRTNEACEPSWFSDGVPRLASVKAGYYTVNMARFS